MVSYPQIVHTWLFGELEFDKIVSYLRYADADGADLSINRTGRYSADKMLGAEGKVCKKMLEDAGLPVRCVTPLHYTQFEDLSSADPVKNQSAVDFVKQCIDITALFGCDRILLSASLVSVNHALEKTRQEHWDIAASNVRELAGYAKKSGVMVMVEPINRYRAALVHTIGETQRFARDAGDANVYIGADVFHMNMEEPDDVASAISRAGEKLKCLHIGENNRHCPGGGVIDWEGVLQALSGIDFDGPLSYEPVSLYFDYTKIPDDKEAADRLGSELKDGILYLNRLMGRV